MTINKQVPQTMVRGDGHKKRLANSSASISLVSFIYYDQPEFDVFWQMVVDLDVPVYFHPRDNPPPVSTLLFDHAPFLSGAVQEFAVTLSNHILGLCTNGVFEYVVLVPASAFLINSTILRQPIPTTKNHRGPPRRAYPF